MTKVTVYVAFRLMCFAYDTQVRTMRNKLRPCKLAEDWQSYRREARLMSEAQTAQSATQTKNLHLGLKRSGIYSEFRQKIVFYRICRLYNDRNDREGCDEFRIFYHRLGTNAEGG